MTQPVSFTTREPNTVEAWLVGNSEEDVENARAWVRTLAPGFTVQVPTPMNRYSIVVRLDDFYLQTGTYHYIVWDGSELRAASKEVFELLYAPTV